MAEFKINDSLREQQERTKKAVESQKPQGYTAEEMKEQWRRNHEASLRKGTDRHYLSEFHKKNSEEAMRILSKQKPLSREEKEAQIERIHKAIEEEYHKKEGDNN